jgi:HK97 family phage prohead protease
MAELDTNNLLDNQFAWIEPGGMRDAAGKTAPRSKRHFPINDESAVRRSLSAAPHDPFGKQAMPRILGAARKFGVKITPGQRSFAGMDTETSEFPERRFVRFPLELRSDGPSKEGPQHIWGYAACFGKLSRRLGGFVEQVNENAFDESKTEGWPDVVCRYNHKDDALLGTTYARTLTLSVDDTGLMYDVVPPDSRRDVLEYVQRGDIRHSSFAFRVFPGGDEWGVSEFDYPMRTLHAVQLIDVAPVLDPAYPDATAAARAMDGAVRSLSDWVQAEPDEVRERLVENRAMEFFKRTDNIGPARQAKQQQQERKKTLTGALALLDLLDNSQDPFTDE